MRPSRTRRAGLPAALAVGSLVVSAAILSGLTGDLARSVRSADTGSIELVIHVLLVAPLVLGLLTFRRREERRRRGEDPLTGHPSHRVLPEELGEVIRASRRATHQHGVVFLRVRGLGEVNATFGYAVGDQLLCDVIDRFEEALGGEEAVYRMGGAEFLAVLPEVSDIGVADALAEAVHAALDAPFSVEGDIHTVTYELGVRLNDDPDAEPLDLVEEARQTAERAREHHDRTVSVNYRPMAHDGPGFDKRRLEKAIADDEFEVWFQPVHDVASGNLVAGEALLRWNHPARGIVPTREFLGLLVDTGLVVEAGRAVLRSALLEAAGWPPIAGEAVSVSVNVTIRELARVDFVDHLSSALEIAGLPWSRLCVEMDEDCLFWNDVQARKILHRLADRGIETALDDFGGGLSSLNHLRGERFTYVKLHHDLVSAIDRGGGDGVLARHLVEMVRSLGMKAVAVGVETVEQLAELDAMACDRLQGALVGKPMRAEEFGAEIARRAEVNERRVSGAGGRPAPADREARLG